MSAPLKLATVADIVRGYTSGDSISQLRRTTGYAEGTIRRVLVMRGIDIRQRRGPPPSEPKPVASKMPEPLVWCEQCDALVSRPAAERCKSPWCKA